MTGRYLTDMADWLREAGCKVAEYPGWKTAARVSGGYATGKPLCVMWHHTASKTSVANDLAYICVGHEFAPVCNLYLARDGTVWTCAAGASNTNGQGNSLTFSHGTVPMNRMNEYAVGIEVANDGVGEWYSQAQVDALFLATLALTTNLGLAPDDVALHAQYAPTRKIDPARADSVGGPWQPRAINASGTWNVSDVREELRERAEIIPQVPGGHNVIAIYQPTFPSPGYDPAWFCVFDSGLIRRATNADIKYANSKGIPTISLDSPDQYDDLLQISGSKVPKRPGAVA